MLQVPQMIPAVWVYTTTPEFNAIRPEGYGSFLTDDQRVRLERIRQARLLFDGKHREYFLNEGRSQFEFPPVRAAAVHGDRIIQMYLASNMLGLISRKNADLMFGEEPLLRVETASDPDEDGDQEDPNAMVMKVQNDAQRDALQALAERSSLHILFHTKATDCSYEGETFLESLVGDDGQVYLQDVPADEIFPVGKMGPDGQFRQYLRMQMKQIGDVQGGRPIYLLLKILYLAGRIERHLYQLDDNGKPLPNELNLDQWPLDVGETPLQPITLTGIPENTITYIPNQLSRGVAVSDHDGLIDHQDRLNAKETQLARVLAKHADPKLAAPADLADRQQGGLRSGHDVYFFRDETQIPRYITWNAELAHALTDREFVREQLLVAAEMAPVLLGIQKQSSRAASYKAIRLEAYNSLTKAQRKAMYQKAGIKRAIRTCQLLENTLPGVRYDVTPIGVELRDGIPIDSLDEANRQSILRAAGLISTKRAVTEQLQDPAAVADELNELAKENAAKQPAIDFGPVGGSAGPGGLEGAPPQNEGGQAMAAEMQNQMEVAA